MRNAGVSKSLTHSASPFPNGGPPPTSTSTTKGGVRVAKSKTILVGTMSTKEQQKDPAKHWPEASLDAGVKDAVAPSKSGT